MNKYLETIKVAEKHVLLESKDEQIKRLKHVMFKESDSAILSLERILDVIPEKFIDDNKLNVDMENLAYAIGRIKASSV